MGAGKPYKAKRAGFKAIFLAFTISIFVASFLYMLATPIVRLVTPDVTLQYMLFNALPLVGISQIGLATSTICWAVMGAQGRYQLATGIAIIGSWIVTIPLAILSIRTLKWNLQGPVAALVIGYTVSGAIQIAFVWTSDWQKLSDQVVEDNGSDCSSASSSSDSDSESLNVVEEEGVVFHDTVGSTSSAPPVRMTRRMDQKRRS
jgi:Na+-driven multidrug efflux pump